MSDSIIQPGQPVHVEFRNIRAKFRQLKSGNLYLGEVEMDEELWNQVKILPEGCRIKGVLWIAADNDQETEGQDTPTPEEKAKPSKGKHGEFWARMHRLGVHNIPELRAVMDIHPSETEPSAWAKMRVYFKVASMAEVSPQEFVAWAEKHGIAKKLPKEAREG